MHLNVKENLSVLNENAHLIYFQKAILRVPL